MRAAFPGARRGARRAGRLSWRLDEEVTLAQARAADARLARGGDAPRRCWPACRSRTRTSSSPRDFPSTAGSKMLAGYRSPFDATVVRRLAEAGTVTLGKLNCDEFAMGSSNENFARFSAAGEEPVGHAPHPRRLLGRQRRGRGRAAGARRHRHRHRRLDPPAGLVLRRHRHQADLRPRLALRHDRLRLQPRPGRPDGAHGRRLRAAAVGDLRARPGPRLHLARRAGRGLHALAGRLASRACASACRRSSSAKAWRPTCAPPSTPR